MIFIQGQKHGYKQSLWGTQTQQDVISAFCLVHVKPKDMLLNSALFMIMS